MNCDDNSYPSSSSRAVPGGTAALNRESFNGKMRDEFLAREIFYSLKEAEILIEIWRRQYNTNKPHSALGYRSPAPAALVLQTVPQSETGGALIDLPIRQVQEHPIFHTDAKGCLKLLEVPVRGDAALELNAMTEDEYLRFVLVEMENVHPGIGKDYEVGNRKGQQATKELFEM